MLALRRSSGFVGECFIGVYSHSFEDKIIVKVPGAPSLLEQIKEQPRA
jgi:hypothetical protein